MESFSELAQFSDLPATAVAASAAESFGGLPAFDGFDSSSFEAFMNGSSLDLLLPEVHSHIVAVEIPAPAINETPLDFPLEESSPLNSVPSTPRPFFDDAEVVGVFTVQPEKRGKPTAATGKILTAARDRLSAAASAISSAPYTVKKPAARSAPTSSRQTPAPSVTSTPAATAPCSPIPGSRGPSAGPSKYSVKQRAQRLETRLAEATLKGETMKRDICEARRVLKAAASLALAIQAIQQEYQRTKQQQQQVVTQIV